MTEIIEIYFSDLNLKTQSYILEKFKTTKRAENWDEVPLAVLEREVEDLYP